MAMKFSVAVRNARADATEATIGTSPVMRIFSGTEPANCAAASTGTVLATLNLPSDWMANAAGGAKTQLGTWSDAAADATGTAGYVRFFDSTGTTCHIQGNVTASGGGGLIELQTLALSAGVTVNITGFNITEGNA